jgi:hypothetical protein
MFVVQLVGRWPAKLYLVAEVPSVVEYLSKHVGACFIHAGFPAGAWSFPDGLQLPTLGHDVFSKVCVCRWLVQLLWEMLVHSMRYPWHASLLEAAAMRVVVPPRYVALDLRCCLVLYPSVWCLVLGPGETD